jgi:hypothetical protein
MTRSISSAAALGEDWCFVTKGFARLVDRPQLLLQSFQDLLFVAGKLAATGCNGFEVVDLGLDPTGVSSRELLISASLYIRLSWDQSINICPSDTCKGIFETNLS